MAYFKQEKHNAQEEQPYQPVFHVPVNTGMDDDSLPADDFPLDEEEKQARLRDNLRLAHSVMDLLGVVVGAFVIVALAALLMTLIDWVHSDMLQSFSLWQTRM